MCSPTAGAVLPYGLKIPSPYFPFGPGGGVAPGHLPALDFQRSQINDYNVRVQLGLRNYQHSLGLSPFHAYLSDPYAQAYFYKHDPRARFVQEEPKPSHSYIGLIGMAILQSKEKKLVLSDIYQWILDNYAYFRTRGPGWRNSIRHNLSLNDCFIKAGRSANGKGHYWAVHPANVEDFERGDFRRRRAQRKVRRHMGLSVPDDDDSPSPSPTQPWVHHDLASPDRGDRPVMDPRDDKGDNGLIRSSMPPGPDGTPRMLISHHQHSTPTFGLAGMGVKKPSRKRLFDMASLLAPDDDEDLPEAKVESDKMYDENPVHLRNDGDYGTLRTDETRNSQEEEKYIGEINRRYNISNMSDEEGENEEDDDNVEEIHVTSDDENTAVQSANFEEKCDNGKDSGDIERRYQDVDNSETNLYSVRIKNSPSPGGREDADKNHRMGIANGIVDKENIILLSQRSQKLESHPKPHDHENNVIVSGDKSSNLTEAGSPRMEDHRGNPSDGLQSYQSPISYGDQTHSIMKNDSGANKSIPESLSQISPMNRPSRLTVPLSVAVSSSNFTTPLSQGLVLPKHASDPSETSSNQTPLLFTGSPYKADLSKLSDPSKTLNGTIRRPSLDHTSGQASDIMRLQTESFSWQPFPKELIRERFSAFNVLDGRGHGLMSQFHQGIMRGVAPFTPQPMLAHSSAFSQGISSPLQASSTLPVSAIPSPANGQSGE